MKMKNFLFFVIGFTFLGAAAVGQNYPGPFTEGGMFPTINFKTADGKILTTDDLKGKIVFYAFDIHDCRSRIDGLNALYDMFSENDNVVFFAVIANSDDQLEQYQKQYGLKFPIVSFDYDTTKYLIIINCRNILVDADGKIVLMKSNVIRDKLAAKKMFLDTFVPAIRKQLK